MYLTPDLYNSDDERWLLFRVPVDSGHLQLFVGALAALTDEWAYRKVGDEKPHETAEHFARILNDMIFYQPPLVGSFVYHIRETVPANWIKCVGGDLAMADWPELMEVYPAVLKNQPSAGRFIVPNWAGRVMMGDGMADYGFNWSYLSTGGSRTHTLTTNEIPAHAHSYVPPTLNVDLEAPGVPDILGAGIGIPTNTGNAGGGAAHNNMQPYGVCHMYMVGRMLP